MSKPKVKIGQVWNVLGKTVTIQRLTIERCAVWCAEFTHDGVEAYFLLNNDWTPWGEWALIQDVSDG